jgi:Tfp pilus assembly protein PilN
MSATMMWNKLKGVPTLDVMEHLDQQVKELQAFKEQFDEQTATDAKFFKAKEEDIRQQHKVIMTMVRELPNIDFKNCSILLTVEDKDNNEEEEV